MTTDKSAADISYSSTSGSVEVLLLGSWGSPSYLYDSANPPTRGWAKLVYDLGWNLTYQHGWDGLNTVGYSNLYNYQIIIDHAKVLVVAVVVLLIQVIKLHLKAGWQLLVITCGSSRQEILVVAKVNVKQRLLTLSLR